MIDNVIPYIGGEEEKSEQEPLRVWGTVENGVVVKAEAPLITTQCIRVPVTDGHTAAVFVKFENKPTKAEILQAIHNPLGVHTMAGIKYRTRSMMGRCQGGYCQMRVAQMIQQELGIPETEVLYARQGSNLFTGKVREVTEE